MGSITLFSFLALKTLSSVTTGLLGVTMAWSTFSCLCMGKDGVFCADTSLTGTNDVDLMLIKDEQQLFT